MASNESAGHGGGFRRDSRWNIPAGYTLLPWMGWTLFAGIFFFASYNAWRVEFDRNNSLTFEDMQAVCTRRLNKGGHPLAALILVEAHKLRKNSEVERLCAGIVSAGYPHPFKTNLYEAHLKLKSGQLDYLGFLKRVYMKGLDLDDRTDLEKVLKEIDRQHSREVLEQQNQTLDKLLEEAEARVLKGRRAEGLAE